MDELEAENKRTAEEHSLEVKTMEQTANDKQKQLIETHQLTTQDLANRYQQDLLAAKQCAEDKLTNMQQVCYISLDRICEPKQRRKHLFVYSFDD